MITTRRLSDGLTRLETTELAERHVILSIADLITGHPDHDRPLDFQAGHYLDAQGRCHWYCDVPPPSGDRHRWETSRRRREDDD